MDCINDQICIRRVVNCSDLPSLNTKFSCKTIIAGAMQLVVQDDAVTIL